MRAIFISYRRDDAEGQAGRLFDDLTQHFGDDAVFMDVAAIEAGRDFRRAIDEQVASCGVLLAIIGKSWLTANDESGARRLNDPMDFVRLETASALKRDIPVVPVLVHGARMPRAEDLPEDLKALAFRNGVELTHARWDSDVQVLMKALQPHVQAKQEPTGPRPPFAPSEPGPTRTGSSWMIIAALVGVLVLAFGGYVWHQKSSEDAAPETAVQQESPDPSIPALEAPPAPQLESKPLPSGMTLTQPGDLSYLMMRRVTAADLAGKTRWELDVMRNEIYARHGRRFDRADLRTYFDRQPWYTPQYALGEFPESLLTSTQLENVRFIREFQRRP